MDSKTFTIEYVPNAEVHSPHRNGEDMSVNDVVDTLNDLHQACQLGQDAMSVLFNALVDYGREGKPFDVDELYRQCLEANEVMLAAIARAEGGE